MRIQLTKYCGGCRIVKANSDFGVNGARHDGLQSVCRHCKRSQQNAWYQKNKARHIARVRARNIVVEQRTISKMFKFLTANPCLNCGEADPLVLEFDHVRGEKTHTIGEMLGRGFSEKAIFDEIAKCEVRCATCHRRKTAKERGYRKLLLTEEVA